jgi:hypothetical protein
MLIFIVFTLSVRRELLIICNVLVYKNSDTVGRLDHPDPCLCSRTANPKGLADALLMAKIVGIRPKNNPDKDSNTEH